MRKGNKASERTRIQFSNIYSFKGILFIMFFTQYM